MKKKGKEGGGIICCNEFIKYVSEKILIIRFSFPVNLKISSYEEVFGGVISYKSHMEEKNDNQCCSFFRVNNKDTIFYISYPVQPQSFRLIMAGAR